MNHVLNIYEYGCLNSVLLNTFPGDIPHIIMRAYTRFTAYNNTPLTYPPCREHTTLARWMVWYNVVIAQDNGVYLKPCIQPWSGGIGIMPVIEINELCQKPNPGLMEP